MGAVYQLASAPCCKATIATAGLAIGSGSNATLLGFNVVGVVVAWILALVTLLENPLGALLTQVCMLTRVSGGRSLTVLLLVRIHAFPNTCMALH